MSFLWFAIDFIQLNTSTESTENLLEGLFQNLHLLPFIAIFFSAFVLFLNDFLPLISIVACVFYDVMRRIFFASDFFVACVFYEIMRRIYTTRKNYALFLSELQ